MVAHSVPIQAFPLHSPGSGGASLKKAPPKTQGSGYASCAQVPTTLVTI